MRLVSWNVNGIRAVAKKGFVEAFKRLDADIFCIQETKANKEQIPKEILYLDYHKYFASAKKKGYSGVGVFTKKKPLSVSYEMPKHSDEGRIVVLEFDLFFLISVYTPNSQRGLARLEYRKKWDKDFLEFIKSFSKPVIISGDMNVAHKEIDLANPKTNVKNAGFTPEERAGFSKYLDAGLIDSFRMFNSEGNNYTWWSYMFNARAKNIGWRIDYFLVSSYLKNRLKSAKIHADVLGSDHCPISIELSGFA